MKKLCLTAVAVIASCVLVSCDPLFSLIGLEEDLNLLASEEEECLTGNTWMLSEVGYALNENDRIDTEEYPEVTSSIESIEFGEDGSFTLNLKESTKFIESYQDDQGMIKERECWFTTYTAMPDGPTLKFGIRDDGAEEFVIQSFRTGGSRAQFDCNLYGREKADGYEVKRMILQAGIGGFYEFIPQK